MQAENLEQLQNFSIRLSGRADHLGLSQTALAEMLGIKLARVSNWFQGRNFPRTRERVELARRLGVRLEWLIHGLGDPENFSSDPVVNEAVAEYGVETHQVPVISWAHAGAAAAYEEMPRHFMGKISAMSRDTRAFALIVEGDSMEPKIVAGDRDAYQYLVESIRRFPPQEELCRRMEAAGFGLVKHRNLSGGIAAIHSGWRL